MPPLKRIKLTDQFEISRTTSGWTCYQKIPKFDDDGNEIEPRWKKTYYPSLRQTIAHVVDTEAGEAHDLEELIKIVKGWA